MRNLLCENDFACCDKIWYVSVYITVIPQKNANKTVIWHEEYKSRQYFIPSATANNNNSDVDWITASTLCRSTVSCANLVSMITDTLQIYLQSNLPTAYHNWTNGISTISYRWGSGEFLLPNIRVVGIRGGFSGF